MMPLARVTIPTGPWLWPSGVLLLAALSLMVWSYRRSSRAGVTNRAAFGFKLLGLLLLALCLVEPLWSGRQATSGANVLVVAADNSSGMNIRDHGVAQTRGEILRDALQAGRTGWLAALAETFQMRQYLFDSRLRRTADFSDLTFDGKATALGAALGTLGERYQGRPLAGVLLLTDGCATDLAEQAMDLSGLPPVYPVVIGRDRPQRDIAVANVAVSQTSFEDAPVVIQADVDATAFAGQTVAADLSDDSGHLVERQEWRVRNDSERQAFRFRLRPDRTGILFYHLHVAGLSADEAPTQEPSLEATPANNQRTMVVNRGKGPYRILYVAGRPNWEYKFLRRAMEEDEQVQLVGLLRVARREPKYDWRGHRGETSNPLYRGFDVQDREEAEQYDEPVLVRLNTRDKTELHEGFPKTAEELFEYHAVILDDVEAEFFSYDQMDLLRRFVTERGGGFLMLGGKESFQQGNYQRTPIGSLLPIHLDPMPAPKAAARTRLSLTREGWLHPWARLRDHEEDEQERLAQMPEFRVVNRARTVRPGARVIATMGADENQPYPALVVQQLGNGRTAALMVGDAWRWGMQKPETRDDLEKFWRQALRWLIADVPERISLQASLDRAGTNPAAVLQVRVRNKDFTPMDDVSISIEVHEPDGGNVPLTASPVPTESGLFEATYVPRASGGYYARAAVADGTGAPLGTAETGWTVDLEAVEFQSIKANRPLLEKIARQTGGRVVEFGELEGFARSLPRRNVPVTEVWTRPLWDLPGVKPGVFLAAMLCFIAEWALRRWKGMP